MTRLYKYLLLASLLAAPAMLSAQTYPEPGQGPEGLEFSKKVTTLEGRNKYQIDLEAFVTGETTVTPDQAVPCDIMLVLDVSTSMASACGNQYVLSSPQELTTGDNIGILHTDNYNSTSNCCYKTNYNDHLRYQIKIGDTMYNLAYFVNGQKMATTANNNQRTGSSWAKPTGWYCSSTTTLSGNYWQNNWTAYTRNSSADTIYTDVKIDLLQKAVNDFIAEIRKNDAGKVGHRIGVATYCGNLTQWCGITGVNNDFTVHTGNATKSQSMTGFVNDLHLHMGGSTRHDLGFDQAETLFKTLYGGNTLEEAFAKDAAKGRSQVVVFFTDGDPNSDEVNTVRKTIQSSHNFKENNASVYSIGIFSDKQIANTDIKLSQFLDYVSSDFPNATTYGTYGEHIPVDEGKSHKFYFKAEGADLSSIFTEIAGETTGGTKLDYLGATSTTVVDVVAESFKLPDNATGADIELYVKKCTGSHLNGVSSDQKVIYEFNGDELDARELFPGITPTVEGKEVKVTGFDFAENYVSEVLDENGKPFSPREFTGYKLIIRFIIEIDPDSPGGAYVNTNTIRSGVYYKNDKNQDIQIATFEIPYVKIPNLVVVKHGLHKGESAIFNMSEIMTDGSEALIENIIIVATCTEEGQPAVARVKIQEPGRYKVTESTWSWAYDLSGVTEKYDDEDSASITDDQWKEKGYDGEIYKKPTKFGTEVSKDGRYIIRNVNDFTEDKTTYKGTVFEFTNSDELRTGEKANPAHAEAINNNEFYESFKQKLL